MAGKEDWAWEAATGRGLGRAQPASETEMWKSRVCALKPVGRPSPAAPASISLSLPPSLFLCPSLPLSLSLSPSLFLSVCLSLSLSLSLSFPSSLFLSPSVSLFLPLSLSVSLSGSLSASPFSLPLSLSLSPSLPPSLSPSLSVSPSPPPCLFLPLSLFSSSLSVSLCVSLSPSLFLSLPPSLCLSPPLCLSLPLSVSLCMSLSLSLPLPPLYVSPSLSPYLCVCVCVSPSPSLSVFLSHSLTWYLRPSASSGLSVPHAHFLPCTLAVNHCLLLCPCVLSAFPNLFPFMAPLLGKEFLANTSVTGAPVNTYLLPSHPVPWRILQSSPDRPCHFLL